MTDEPSSSDYIFPFPVTFHYLDKEDIANREFVVYCVSVPRIGDKIFANDDSGEFTVVCEVSHKFFRFDPSDQHFMQAITVLLRDSRPSDSDQSRFEFRGE